MISKFAGITQVFIRRSLFVSRGFPCGADREIIRQIRSRNAQRSTPYAQRPRLSETLGGEAVNRFLNTVVSWLRAGYPTGVPANDYLPILALLSRRLTKDEVLLVARQLMGMPEPDFADIGAEIMLITDEVPAPADVERVREKLLTHGWPLDDPRDSEDAE